MWKERWFSNLDDDQKYLGTLLSNNQIRIWHKESPAVNMAKIQSTTGGSRGKVKKKGQGPRAEDKWFTEIPCLGCGFYLKDTIKFGISESIQEHCKESKR